MTRRRLDVELVARGLAATRVQAQQAIEARRVLVGGAHATKASMLVAPGDDVRLTGEAPRFVSRGGDKLAGALDDLDLDVAGRRCLDAGAGSGGFTDCLLQRGARSVVAVDVGYGQFDWRLRGDRRVRLLERVNLRTADPALLGGPFDLVVADLSFISLRLVLDPLLTAAGPEADLLLLVKPQFEAGRGEVGRGGIVRDPHVWASTIRQVARALAERGVGTAGVVPSRVPGASGNREFFLWARRGAAEPDDEAVARAVASVA